MSGSKRHYHLSLVICFLILTLLISSFFPYGNVFASKSNPGEGMPVPNVKNRAKILNQFPKMGNSPIEIKGKRNAKERQFLNPDGSFTVETYAQPIHWQNKKGQWVDIDNSIVASDDMNFPFKNASNDLQVKFAQNITNQAINRIQYKNQYVEFVPQGSQKTIGLPKGNKISYSKIYPSVDFDYTVLPTGVKENIVLADASAQSTFTFALNTDGLTPKANEDGSISLMDDKGHEIYLVAKPYAFDNNDNETENVTSVLRQDGSQWYVDIALDEAWLKDASRSFPVTIDPTVFFQPTNANVQDTSAASGYPTMNYNTKTYLVAGYNANGQNRSYVYFNLPSLYSGANISSATLDLYQYLSETNTDTTIDIHRISKAWQASNLN